VYGFRSYTSEQTHPEAGFNYLAFDIIGDLAFGSPFGMLIAGRDSADVALSEDGKSQLESFPAVQILNERGEFSASMGTFCLFSTSLDSFHETCV
jgi:hypothetical protein